MSAATPWLDPKRFARSHRYNPAWVEAAISGGANPLVLTEWLVEPMNLTPGQRVLDLGAGRGASSVFLAREFGVQVWAVDLWFSADERQQRANDAGVGRQVFALHADARDLRFPTDFFDALVAIDCFPYFGTDDLYLDSLARFLRSGSVLGIAGAGLTRELATTVPTELQDWWDPSLWCLHSARWWRDHWSRTGYVDIDVADSMPDAWQQWLAWQRRVAPDNAVEIEAVTRDAGRSLTYIRVIGTRSALAVGAPVTTVPTEYQNIALATD